MSGDYTRFTFDPRQDHSGVLMQQGRVMLDADFNELVELIDRRLRAETIDIIGHCIVPSETPDAFLIGLAGGGITIGPGRMYADGLLAENHGGEPREWYAALEEERGTTPIAYEAQPYLPDAANLQPAPTQGGPYLVYADVWKREVTRTEDAGLVEKAVGVDTATRTQTVWQVKVYPPSGSDVGLKGPITCDTPDGDITGWLDFTAPSAGRLTTEGQGVPASDDPCVIPPDGGYRGSENRLYRVEVHDPGGLGAATFKWSRDNASIATNVLAIDAARTELTVTRTARDAVLRFSTGDWVEVTDDEHELYGLPGVMRKVGPVDDVALTLTLTTALPAGTFDATDPLRHTRVKRWDQTGIVRDAAQNAVDDVDANGGVIKVPAAGTTLVIEDGIQVTLSVDPAGGRFRSGDYWVFAARTVDASVDELVKAPPRGIHHHYCRIAIVDFGDKGGPEDCRTIWPLPCQCEGEGGTGCGCDACVTVESHGSGTLTIQDAVKQVVEAGGGTVCIGPGRYPLRQGVAIDGALSLRVRGSGIATVLLYAGDGPALSIDRSIDVRVNDMTVIGVRRGETAQNTVEVSNSAVIGLERVTVFEDPVALLGFIQKGAVSRPHGAAISLGGVLADCTISDCLLVAGTGVASLSPGKGDQRPFLVLADLAVRDDVIFATHSGVQLGGGRDATTLILLDRLTLTSNSIYGCVDAGVVVAGFQSPTLLRAGITVRQSTLGVFGHGVILGTGGAIVQDNVVTALGRGRGDAVREVRHGIGLMRTRTSRLEEIRVVANRVLGFSGNGVAIAGTVASVAVTDNVVRACGGGVVMLKGSSGDRVSVRSNTILDAAPVADDAFVKAFGIVLVGTTDGEILDNHVRFTRARGGAAVPS
jgi:hypothetical protein